MGTDAPPTAESTKPNEPLPPCPKCDGQVIKARPRPTVAGLVAFTTIIASAWATTLRLSAALGFPVYHFFLAVAFFFCSALAVHYAGVVDRRCLSCKRFLARNSTQVLTPRAILLAGFILSLWILFVTLTAA